MDARISLLGFFIGLLVGFTGVGGSAVAMPILVLYLRMSPIVAVGTDIVYSIPMKWLGTVTHMRQQTVDWTISRLLLFGGIPSAIVGIGFVVFLRFHIGIIAINTVLRHSIGWLLFIVALGMIVSPILRYLRQNNLQKMGIFLHQQPTRFQLIALGAIVGFVVSVTSIGGGSLTLPLLYFIFPEGELRRLVGTDVVFSACLIPLVALGYLHMGNIDMPIAASLAIGSLPGVYIGSKLCKFVPNAWFRPTLAIVLFVTGLNMV